MSNSIDTNLPTRLAAIVVALRSPTPDAALAPLLEGPRTGRTVTLDADELAELLTAAAAPAADSGFWSDLWLDLEADQAAHERCDNGAGLAQTARRAISEGQRLARERDLWRALCVRQRDALRSAYEEGGRSAANASHAAEREARIVSWHLYRQAIEREVSDVDSLAEYKRAIASLAPIGRTMTEVNRERRARGELGTKRQRAARRGRP